MESQREVSRFLIGLVLLHSGIWGAGWTRHFKNGAIFLREDENNTVWKIHRKSDPKQFLKTIDQSPMKQFLSRSAAMILAAVAFQAPSPESMGAEGPLVVFSGNGSLKAIDRKNQSLATEVLRGPVAKMQYIEGVADNKNVRGLYIPEGSAISVPIPSFNPQEGTISFWFRPDWAIPSYHPSLIMQLNAPPAFNLTFRKGHLHAPDHCYVDFLKPDGSDAAQLNFGPHNLFTARKWRHYAIRWSSKGNKAQFVVDGDVGSPWRRGPFKNDVAGPLNASLLLTGEARGAIADIKVFDRYVETAELVTIAGLTKVATYLQEMRPPEGMESESAPPVSFVDPSTGQRVNTEMPSEELQPSGHRTGTPYNPDNVKDLPITPHTPWARPLAGGPVRVLFVMPTGVQDELKSLIREGVELWQRLEMKCEITNKFDRALSKQDYDVIVISHQGHDPKGWLGWRDLEPSLRSWITERVSSGKSGLVLAYPTGLDETINAFFDPAKKVSSESLLRGFPVGAMNRAIPDFSNKVYDLGEEFFQQPDDLAKNIVEVFQSDDLRAVRLNYKMGPGWGSHPGLTPDTAVDSGVTLVQYDCWMALAARAVLFAAGREPLSKIHSASISGTTWRVSIQNNHPNATLEYRARDIWDREYAAAKLQPESADITIPGVELPPRAIVDFILKDDRGEVLDWYSATTPAADKVRISALRLEQDFYEKGKTVEGRIDISSNEKSDTRVEVYLSDHEGRRLIKQSLDLTGKSDASFTLAIPNSTDSLLMRVESDLFVNGALVDTRSADCPVPVTDDGSGFYFTMYSSTHNRAVDTIRRRIFRDQFGVSTIPHQGGHTYGVLARDNLQHVKYTTHLGYPRDEKGMEFWMQDWSKYFPEHLDGDLSQMMRFRPLFYSLGEEHLMEVEGSNHPEVNRLFREHLKEKYGDINSLNREWNQKFTSWEEIRTATPEMLQTVKSGSLRFESRGFMEKLFADKHAYLADYFRKADPEARVGIHTSWDLWISRGYDFWLLSRGMDSIFSYEGPQEIYCRSFFKHYYGAFNHYWIGSHENVRWHPWRMLINGAKGIGWYIMSVQIWGASTSDLRFTSDWEAAAPECKAATEAGNLLAKTAYQQDQVAVHYSQDSFRTNGPTISWIHAAFINLLFDSGTPFRFISYQQITEGDLLKTKPAVLILPHSVSLSSGEAEAIRTYVKNGGTLWADVIPGVVNEFGRTLPESRLADLFANLTKVPMLQDREFSKGAVGKGKVFLGDIKNFGYARNQGEHVSARRMAEAVMKAANVRQVARVSDAKTQKPANGVWTGGYRSGSQRYLVTAKDYALVDQSASDMLFEMEEKGHIYEMRSGRYLGWGNRFITKLKPTIGQVFCVFPYRVLGIEMVLASHPKRGEDLVIPVALRRQGNIGPEDLHLLRVKVTAPNGKECIALRRQVSIWGGKGEIRLPLAYNDMAGTWEVLARDTATGLEMSIDFQLPAK